MNQDEESNVIRVSFKNRTDDQKLKKDILKECKIIGKSNWMKLAAIEKLERDNKNNFNQTHQQNINTSPIKTRGIESLDQLFINN